MKNLKGFEKITDYAWIKKGRKYWNIWVGNPFCISLHKVPLSIPKEEIETLSDFAVYLIRILFTLIFIKKGRINAAFFILLLVIFLQ